MTDDILKGALERFKESQDGSDFNRENAYDDILFGRMGRQWPDKIKRQRQEEGRPCLTINRMPAFIRQVINDARQNKPSIVTHPVDNGADEDTSEVINGILRSIERNSQADVAYDTAIDHAVSGGFGFFRISLDYAHDESFDLEARIDRIANPLSVHWDVNSTEFDASDWDYAFVSDFLTEEEFKNKYPKADPVSFEGGQVADDMQYWLEDNKTRVAEYWLREEEKKKLYLISGPKGAMSVREDALPKMAEAFLAQMGLPEGDEDEIVRFYMEQNQLEIARTREVDAKSVTRRIISGAEVLDEEQWPGSMIPICPVWGEEVFADGRRNFRSMIRDARDPQNMFNFWRSATTELVALAPKAPWVGPQGFVPEGQESKWESANTRSHAYLEFDPAVGAPQRDAFAGVPAGALQESLNAADDMKAIIGIYDSSLGARSNETSGKAILARQKEADVSNFHFIDNLSRAIQYAGRCLVEIIPAVYSERQTIRILGEDMKEKVIKLGQQSTDGDKLYDLSIGRYDVTVKSGPSFSTQREETRETLIEIMRAVPGAGQYVGDILLEHMDFQGADKVAKRLRMLLPQNVQDAENAEAREDIPEEARGAIMQLEGVNKQLQGQLQQMQQALESEQGKVQADMQKMQMERESDAAKFNLDAEKTQAELELKARDIALKERHQEFVEMQAALDAEEKARTAMVSEQETGQRMETEAKWQDTANALQMLVQKMADSDAVAQQRHDEVMSVATAPKTVQFERGPDGLIAGATQEVAPL